ncbi:MAG: glucosamine-6-phosphate deaminase, partial [Planctomycetota bacterium]
MNILICETAEAAAELVAQEILAALRQKPGLVLGLATGSTPVGVYARLVRAHREQQVDLAGVRTFNLDEYVGLPADHPQSYRAFMHKHLFSGLELPAGHVQFPPSEGPALRRRCADYEQAIRDADGIEIQLLGIGSNGHIGFNEPTSSLASRTRLKTLTDKTLRDNARLYGPEEEQPQVAATMGIGTILQAR